MTEGGSQVADAVRAMLRVLRPEASRDWAVPAAGLEWSCWTTAVHVAHDLVAHSGQIAGEARSKYLPFDLSVSVDSTPSDVFDVVGMAGAILATVVSAAEPSARAWHYGSTDPVGFAAMGVGETIVLTYDIADGLGLGGRRLATFVSSYSTASCRERL